MKKITFVISLVMVLSLLVSCTSNQQTVEGVDPQTAADLAEIESLDDDVAIAGQAYYDQLTADDLAQGVMLDANTWNSMIWPEGLEEQSFEDVFEEDLDNIEVIYEDRDGTWYKNPAGSFPLTNSFKEESQKYWIKPTNNTIIYYRP